MVYYPYSWLFDLFRRDSLFFRLHWGSQVRVIDLRDDEFEDQK